MNIIIPTSTLTSIKQQQQPQQHQHQRLQVRQQHTVTVTAAATATTTHTLRTNYVLQQQQQQQQQQYFDAAAVSVADGNVEAFRCHRDKQLNVEECKQRNLNRCLRDTEHVEMRAIQSATKTSQQRLSNMTTTLQSSFVDEDSESICLMCRQQLAKCCLRCCQQLLAVQVPNSQTAAATTPTSTTTKATTVVTARSCRKSCCSCRRRMADRSKARKTPATTTTSAKSSICHCCQNSSCIATAKIYTTPTAEAMPNIVSNDNKNDSRCSCPKSFQNLSTSTTTRRRTSLTTLALAATSSLSPTSLTTAAPAAATITTTNVNKLPAIDSRTNDSQILPTETTATTATTAKTTTTKSYSAKYFSNIFFNSALKNLQLLLLFMQLQVLLLFKTRKRRRLRHRQQQHQHKQYQQHGPPFTRLRFRSNSYKATNSTASLRLHHQQQLQHQQQQQQQQKPPLYLFITPRRSHLHQNQPNYSILYLMLIILSFLSTFLPSTQAQTSQKPVTLMRNETVCKSLDIRNTPKEFSQLRNCTVIEGFLLISLMGSPQTNATDFAESTITFPLLTEVTEYILVYRVHYLRSLAQIFPNLSIIRGHELFEGYALTVYSNPHIEDIGLSNLITISRGGVRIENNLSLCFVNTIDWSHIVSNNTTDITIKKNRADSECPKCPGDAKEVGGGESGAAEIDVTCKERNERRHCWNTKTCQKFCPDSCPDNCIDENTCCNESCIGGCSTNNHNACNSCRHFSIHNSSCIDTCPRRYYTYLDRRCITARSCARIGSKFENDKEEQLVPYGGQCSTRCPEGYNKIDGTCRRCGDKCKKYCVGSLIDSVARAKEFHGCTHIINSGLTISIKRGGRHLMEDLEFGLSSIEVIETYLKVHRTYGMFSLEYFKNLRQISGEKLCEESFALYMLENNDLETIWNPNQTVRIEKGRVFFHFNPKLCVSVINALLPMLKNNATFDKNEVATDSNGSKGSCNTEYLNTTVTRTSHTMAVIQILNPLEFEDERTFIGYQSFYMEDKYKNASKHAQRPCDDVWNANEPTKETTHMYASLKPFTQYAYYVKTMTISSEPRNAESPIQYFKTKSAQPKNVRIVSSFANSSSEIVLIWLPPTHIYGNLTMYKVQAVLAPKNPGIESRNYCKDPLKEAAKIDQPTQTPTVVTEKPLAGDCKCPKNDIYDEDQSDANIHDSIDFENTVQNFVYVKQPNVTERTAFKWDTSNFDNDLERRRRRRSSEDNFDSFLLRHMRALPGEQEATPTSSSNSISLITTSTIPPTVESSTNSSLNQTVMDPNGEYITKIIDTVNATTNQFVFQHLKHFSVYLLSVEACRAPEINDTQKQCSKMMHLFVRTMKRDDVDLIRNLRVSRESTNTTRSNIRIRWDPPESPNGDIVSYTISYEHQTQDAEQEKRCITELDYQNLTNGYLLTGLPTGNYSIRVRANSLAGEGIYSENVTIFIPPTEISSTVIAIICIAVLTLLGLIAGLIVYLRKKILAPPSDLKIFPTVNPYYISLQYIPDDWEVPRERIIQLSALGQGSFGMVYEGILKGFSASTEDMPCAIKTVNENATDRERMNFLNEASVMKQFDTFHVVRLLGVVSRGQPALVVMELMKNGDLKSYLRAHRPDERDDGLLHIGEMTIQPPPLSRIYQMAIEIADGMAYLSAKKFVHRDLAARNCMVAADLTVKIGDFGMTRDIYETDYYRKGTKGLLPVRWMPPESLRDGVYSSASDVFSYGVVLWEMSTLASQPYQGLSNDQVLRYVIDGGVMERPENCPDKLYRMMQKCWHHRPTARPSFMEIIRTLLDHANAQFAEVSFYHSEEGQLARNKELADSMHNSGDVYQEHDDMDDVTTPLRVGEYNEYKLNMENNSSVENQNDSPVIDQVHHPHSPYSLGSANIASSTPDGKNSYNLSQMSHNNPTLSSAPSTSAGIVSSGGRIGQLHQPQKRMQPISTRFPQHLPSLSHGDEAAYVQPDYNAGNFEEDAITLTRNVSKSADTDDRGYQIYDPSPNYREHAPYEDEDLPPASGKLSGGQNLLPKQRSRQRLATIMPMSSSMPNEAISVPMSSSLHPSTASAASSNASSNATTGATTGTVGKYPSLKKAVSETVQSVGNSLVPQRLRNMNRFFNHKRSGSNTSHKSTGSNPNPTYSNSMISNSGGSGVVSSGRGKSISGSNLGTIESGGSGSAGSYAPAPRFFTTHTNDNPNYNLLDESANASGITVADGVTPAKTSSAPVTVYKPRSGFGSNSNPNYQLLNESLNTSASPTRSSFTAIKPQTNTSVNPNYELMQAPKTSENPTYELMQAPNVQEVTAESNPNYVVMNEPQKAQPSRSVFATLPPANLSENPNYQIMGPPPAPAPSSSAGFSALSAAMRREQSAERSSIGNSHSSHSASATSSDGQELAEEDEDEDELHGDGIKMERIPLSRSRRGSERKDAKHGSASRSRSRSQSQTKSEEKVVATPTPPVTKITPTAKYKVKENWMKPTQQQKPPPNGFIGREG